MVLRFTRLIWSLIKRTKLADFLPDEMYIRFQFLLCMGKRLDLDNPKDFNEKLQWLKLRYHNPLMSICSDKYEVRKYVSQKIGEHFLLPLLGVYDDVDRIPFDSLPKQCVLKATHGSGWNIICKDASQIDVGRVKHKLKKWLASDFSTVGRELHYRNIKPRIICENFLVDPISRDLRDYKLLTFNGVCKYIWVDYVSDNGKRCRNIYDKDWVFQRDKGGLHPRGRGDEIPRPECLKEMITAAYKLAECFPQCRVDFYVTENKYPFFGEMTFTSGNGLNAFYPAEFCRELGGYITLPEEI